MVINTGYGTKRGRILRKILNKNSNTPQFFKTFIYFLIEMYIVGVIIYLATLSMRI
jgi:magnesium-transporting ATPase (P-type)